MCMRACMCVYVCIYVCVCVRVCVRVCVYEHACVQNEQVTEPTGSLNFAIACCPVNSQIAEQLYTYKGSPVKSKKERVDNDGGGLTHPLFRAPWG